MTDEQREKYNAYQREYRAKNIDKVRAYRRDYYQKNREKILQQWKEWKDRHPEYKEKKKSSNKKYYHSHWEYCLAKSRLNYRKMREMALKYKEMEKIVNKENGGI